MMIDSKLDAIIKNVKKQKKVFAKKEALDTSNHPTVIISRANESEKILGFILDYQQGYVVPLVSIYGRSGTGKSTIVKHICNYIKEIKLCFVNLRKSKTLFGAINLILNELDQPSLTSAQGMNLGINKIREAILNKMNLEGKKLFVLVLDEFDVIFNDKRNNPSDFVYKLVELIAELKEKKCIAMLFTISNNVLSDYALDDRIRSRIGNSEIFFKPYTLNETFEILKQKSSEAFSEKISDEILTKCATVSFSEHGDARRAVDLLRVSAEIAANEHKPLTTTHVTAASEQLQKDRVKTVASSLSYQSKMILIFLAAKIFCNTSTVVTTMTLFDTYKRHLANTAMVSYRTFFELLNDLENTGLIESTTRSKGQKGYRTEYVLLIDPRIIGDAIDSIWWKKYVVDYKAELDKKRLNVKKSDPMYRLLGLAKDDPTLLW